MSRKPKEFYQEIGRKGGRRTVERYGREHMATIGRVGFLVTTNRYFAGNSELHKNWLANAGLHVYWLNSGLNMKRDEQGFAIWPETMPIHPAKLTPKV